MAKVIESPAVRVEQSARERGELEIAIAVVAALEAAHLLASRAEAMPWLLVLSLLLAFGLRVVRRGLWARRSAPGTRRVTLADGRAVVDGERGHHAFALADPPEGWSTPLDHGAVVALRTVAGGLLSFQVRDAEEATRALAAAGLGANRLPRQFRLDRQGPWNGWLALATRRMLRRAAFAVAILGGVALVSVAPVAGRFYAYALVAASLGLRALALCHRPRVTIEPGAIVLDALAFHRRVELAPIASVEETPGGVSLLAANGTETLLPLATRPPIRRASAKAWISESELRDSALAQREALAGAVRAARTHRSR